MSNVVYLDRSQKEAIDRRAAEHRRGLNVGNKRENRLELALLWIKHDSQASNRIIETVNDALKEYYNAIKRDG